jgi:hypothetical protein
MATVVLKRTMRVYLAPVTVSSASALTSAYREPFVDQDLNSAFDTADRNVVLNSLVNEHPFTVRENLTGSLTKELYFASPFAPTDAASGAGFGWASADVPDHFLLQNAGLNAGNGGTNSSAAGASSAYTYTNSQDPVADWLTLYKFFLNDQPSTGSGEVYAHTSARVTGVTWNFAVGAAVEPQFTFGGLTTTTTSALATPTDNILSSQLSPAIPKSMTVTIGGQSFELTDLTLTIAGDTQNVESICTTGITNIVSTGYNFTGSFNILYGTADDFYKKFITDTTASITAVIFDQQYLATGSGKKITFTLPHIKYSNVTPGVTNDFLNNAVEFSAANPVDQSSGAMTITYENV